MPAPTTHLQPPLPLPLFTSPYQSGITDPMWPAVYPNTIDPAALKAFYRHQIREERLADDGDQWKHVTKKELKAAFERDYVGRVAMQGFQSVVRADVLAWHRAELQDLLHMLTEYCVEEILRNPSVRHIRLFEPIPESYRVTITVGFGASLFVDRNGGDRFGLAGVRPKYLKPMPSFDGDHPDFKPETSASDLIMLVSSDHPYINLAIVRFFCEFLNRLFSKKHHVNVPARDVIRFKGVEEGFARKDKREFLRFDDGIQNLQMDADELRRLVYVDASDHEPAWCANGTYLVYRKIRERMPVWESLEVQDQEKKIGRRKEDGAPLSPGRGDDRMTPLFTVKTPVDAHIRKVQPRRKGVDLFGLNDLERRFLRRPYPFFDGLDAQGEAINGLQFIAFMSSIQRQFEHIVNMWQMNPDFPEPGTGVDALYGSGVLSTIDGGYYFCPPGLRDANDYFGSGMFGD